MNEPTVIASLKQLILKNRAKPPRSFECGGFVVLMRWVIMCPTAGNLNLRLAVFDLSGGGVYSINMELLNHHDGMVIPSRWNGNTI